MILLSKLKPVFVSFSLSAILYFCFVPTLQSDPRHVVIGADPWCPFICVSSGSQKGIMVDIAKEALALSGYEMSYVNINWLRAKRMVRSGAIDGLVGTAKSTPEKTPYDFPETALGEVEVCFYRLASEEWEYKSPQSLAPHTMGWINDYLFSANPEINEWVNAHKGTSQLLTISGMDTHLRLFKLLLAGRISTFADDRFVISYALNKQGLQDKIAVAGCTGQIEKVYVAFSQKTGRGALLAKALDNGVEELRRNGRLVTILETYGLKEDSWMSH